MSAPPTEVERDFPLGRLTTVRIGGPADWFATPRDPEQLAALLAWARDEGLALAVIGSGSNMLVADEGFRGLVLKLEGDLATVSRDGERLVCGGGARLPRTAARAASWGLAGLEFGVNIPGTVGGAVRMNANAYGGELAAVLEWVEVCSPSGRDRRAPEQLGFEYRSSNLEVDDVVALASFKLAPGDPATIKETMGRMRGQRRDAQPSGIKTFGSTFKNPPGVSEDGTELRAGNLLQRAGCGGLQLGGARFAAKHANFVEIVGDATTADVLELMALGRRRVHERFGIVLEPEVQVLGEARWPEGWEL